MLDLIWLVPLFPLIGVLINGLVGIRFSKRTIGTIGCLTVFSSFVVSCGAFWELIQLPATSRIKEVVLWQWIPCGDLIVDLGFLVDPLSIVMLLPINLTSNSSHTGLASNAIRVESAPPETPKINDLIPFPLIYFFSSFLMFFIYFL